VPKSMWRPETMPFDLPPESSFEARILEKLMWMIGSSHLLIDVHGDPSSPTL
jgi:hypothetical protein